MGRSGRSSVMSLGLCTLVIHGMNGTFIAAHDTRSVFIANILCVLLHLP